MKFTKPISFLTLFSISSITATIISHQFGKIVEIGGINLKTSYFPIIVMFVVLLSVFLLAKSHRYTNYLTQNIPRLLEKESFLWATLVVLSLVLFECVQDLIFLNTFNKPPHYQTYINLLEYLYPLLVYGILFSLMTFLFLFIYGYWKKIFNHKVFHSSWIYIFIGLIMGYSVSLFSEYGFVPFTNREHLFYIYGDLVPTSSPIIGTQVFAVMILLVCTNYLLEFIHNKYKWSWKRLNPDILIIVIIYLITIFLWMDIPLESNSFLDMSKFSEAAVYPISDAFYFDKEALNLINTGGFTDNTTHVFYSFFLAILHAIKGPDFLDVIWFQVAFLSLIPVLLFLLTKTLHTRFSGVVVASFYIIRERNGLLLLDDVSGTYVTQMMTESFALLILLGFLYVFVLWMQSPREKKKFTWIAGALIGIGLLVRAELLAVLIAVSFGAMIHLWNQKKELSGGLFRLFLIVGIIVIPWMSRNYLRNGNFSLDKQSFLKKRITSYISNIYLNPVDEGDNTADEQSPLTRPKPKLRYIPNQIVSSAWQSILVLPTNFQPFYTFPSLLPELQDDQLVQDAFFAERYAERYVKSSPYFWYSWDGNIEPRSIIPIIFVLFAMSVGIWSVWKQGKMILIILPLTFFSHIMIWAFARYSGGRFIKPSDWIPMFFFGIGLSVFVISILERLGLKTKPFYFIDKESIEPKDRERKDKRFLSPILTTILVLIGLSPVIAEIVIPDYYFQNSDRSVLISKLSVSYRENIDQIENLIQEIDSSTSRIFYGKALYPRYFEEGEAYEDNRKGKMPEASHSRVDFYLIGEQEFWVSLPVDSIEFSLSHYDDVVIFGDFPPNIEGFGSGVTLQYFLADKIVILDK